MLFFQGFEILEELEEAVSKSKPKNTLQMLSSKFYTAIPHDFGRRTPPVISTTEGVQMKYDMLAVSNSMPTVGCHTLIKAAPPPLMGAQGSQRFLLSEHVVGQNVVLYAVLGDIIGL